MKGPRSIETTRGQCWEFLVRAINRKGKPVDRKMQVGICESIADSVEGITKKGDGDYQLDMKPPDFDALPEEERNKAVDEFVKARNAWMDETVFAELDKKQRSFLWALYAADWAGEMVPLEEAKIERVAKALGKSGALADMRDDVEEWTDGEAEAEDPPADGGDKE